jgi:hypothetical protein
MTSASPTIAKQVERQSAGRPERCPQPIAKPTGESA